MQVAGHTIGPNADLEGVDLSGARLAKCDLSGANLRDCVFTGARLVGANLSGADLSGAVLIDVQAAGSNLQGANLTCADLSGAFLANANLRGCNLTETKFEGTQLSGADLTGATSDGAILESVHSSPATIWPEHFDSNPTSTDFAKFTVGSFEEIVDGPLAQFVEREGHAAVRQAHVERFDGTDFKLGLWVSGQRRRYQRGQLSGEHVAALEGLPGWEWNARAADHTFEWWIDGPFRQFYEREKGNPKFDHVELFEGQEVRLGAWCASLRALQKKGELAPEREKKAEDAGFTWSVRNRRRSSEDDAELTKANLCNSNS
mgnify:CR=1 FL=1